MKNELGDIETIALVGYTGFVGSNIYDSLISEKRSVKGYNTKNISEAFNTNPDLLIYAGLRAEKFLANSNPDADYQSILNAEENIKKINPGRVVQISTIDVLKDTKNKLEDDAVETDGLLPYGLNRYKFEQWVREYDKESLIIRLPGLYGKNIKKNFIYDYIHMVPHMLKEDKYKLFVGQQPVLKNYYHKLPNGFYECQALNSHEEKELIKVFKSLGFTALNFTDSRSIYQFFPLSKLWHYIKLSLAKDIKLLHTATEPIQVAELYKYLSGSEFHNEVAKQPFDYDYKTRYSDVLGGYDGYLMKKDDVMKDIKNFVNDQLSK